MILICPNRDEEWCKGKDRKCPHYNPHEQRIGCNHFYCKNDPSKYERHWEHISCEEPRKKKLELHIEGES